MTDAPLPPGGYATPFAYSALTMDLISQGVHRAITSLRRARQVRALERICVLPPGWDAAGRHCPHH